MIGDYRCGHDQVELGAYATGLLDAATRQVVNNRLAVCPRCRAELEGLLTMSDLLADQPPELFLDGPPDGDLVLRRAVREIRRETGGRVLRRRVAVGVAAAAVGAAVLGGGYAIGRSTGPETSVVAGGVVLTGSGVGGSTLQATLNPVGSWVRVGVKVSNLPAGQRCYIVVTDRSGNTQVAGSWIVGQRTESAASLDGSAAVALSDVASVAIRNDQGTEFVKAARA